MPPSSPRALPCPHFPDCVGCALIGKPYTQQLALKRERVREALGRYPSLAAVAVPELVGAPHPFGYRNQAKLVARRAGRGVLLGIYRPGTHQVVDVTQCPVHHPLINPILQALTALVERYEIPTYDERSGHGVLRYVVVRVSQWSRSAQIILVTRGRTLPHARELVRALLRLRGVKSVVQNINDTPGNVILGSEFIALTRETALLEHIGVFKLKTHPGAFVQANVAVARKLYEQALRWAAPTDEETVVDLYCGIGALSCYLATAAKLVIGIEASSVAVVDAKANIRLNGFHNLRFHCGDAAAVLAEQARPPVRVDVITLNPPRKGADAATRAAIVACRPRRMASPAARM